MNMTYHCAVERKERVMQIVEKIGIGQVVREKYTRTREQVLKNQKGKYICITDTGVTLIKTEDKSKIITMYVTTYRELLAVYGGQKNIPPYLRKKVDRNQTFFTKDGRTIWK